MAIGPVCVDTLQRLRGVELHPRLSAEVPSEPVPPGWIMTAADLAQPESAPLSSLLARFATAKRRAASAALLLRCGWASGFAIASYLTCERVPQLDEYTLYFSERSLLHTLWIREARFYGRARDALACADDWAGSVQEGDTSANASAATAVGSLRRQLLESLLRMFEPLVQAQHRWSGFSRHALWSMAVSSWAAQLTGIARQLGDAGRGIEEAHALLAQDPEIARAAPQLYEIRIGDSARTFQRMAACCLYFKSPGRRFCASCPVLPAAERLERNERWLRQIAQGPSLSRPVGSG